MGGGAGDGAADSVVLNGSDEFEPVKNLGAVFACVLVRGNMSSALWRAASISASRNRYTGSAPWRSAETMMMPIALAVGCDMYQLRPTPLIRECADEPIRKMITARQ